MEPKDWRYDPTVNYDSGSDTELLNNETDKLSPPSSPTLPVSWGTFVHNDLRSLGGPQADKPQGGATAAVADTKKKPKCIFCGNKTEDRYEGSNYGCHKVPEDATEEEKKQHDKEKKRHNKFCLDCAVGKKPKNFTGIMTCPKHGDPLIPKDRRVKHPKKAT